MKIGKATIPESAICASDDETIVVRGADLCKDLIGRLSFTDYFWLLVTGQRPSPMASRVLDATLVAIAEHGLVPSVQASRMTLAAAPAAIQGAVAAGILGCGSVTPGASETAGGAFLGVGARAESRGLSIGGAAGSTPPWWRWRGMAACQACRRAEGRWRRRPTRSRARSRRESAAAAR